LIKLTRDIAGILTKKEKRQVLRQVAANLFMIVMDVGALALLLFLIHVYFSSGSPAGTFPGYPFLKSHPYLVLGIFCVAFAGKNYLAQQVLRADNEFLYSVATRLSEEKLDRYFQSSYASYVQVDSSVHIRGIAHQPVEFVNYVLRGMQQVVIHSLLVLLTVSAILVYNAALFLLLIGILCLPILITSVLLKKKLNRVRSGAKEAGEQSLQYLKEALSGFIESRIYFRKEFFTRRYIVFQERLNHFLSHQQIILGWPARLMESFAVAGLFLLFVFHQPGTDPAASFITIGAFMAAAYKIIPGIVKVLNGIGQVRAYEFVLTQLPRPEKKKEEQMQEAEEEQIRRIRFSNVAFAYGSKQIFSGLDFEVSQGDLVCICGASGMGKTTMINLLLGFVQPDEGRILFNGKRLQGRPLWKRVSYVKQQPFFIHDSAFQNVVLGASDHDEERLREAESVTGFHTFMNGSAQKMIRENGKNISGGQRQRIALARALYKDFDLLVLDEPFSELDRQSEAWLLLQLKKLADKGKIILLITHHLNGSDYFTKTLHLDETKNPGDPFSRIRGK
jgi:ABC-type multidrug transport system fused ATPase/permease subunit